jgi:hypothetical protein
VPRHHAISARIRDALPSMMLAIHFHDQPNGWCDEVRHIATDRHLTPEPNARPAARDLGPELLFRRRQPRAHLPRAFCDERLMR